MEEYISKNRFQESIKSVINDSTCPIHIATAIQQYIEEEPTADVAPVVHAKWETGYYDELGNYVWPCSNCKRESEELSPYCNNCGAKMDLTDD